MCPPESKTIVNLRVEGKSQTLYEASLGTCGHRVTLTSGQKYHCNGTNNDQNPCTGPTCTTALDDSKIGFNGTYYSSFDDLLITTIGPDTAGNNEFWAILLNFQYISVGGCQQQVRAGDDVLFALVAGQANQVVPLKLSGPIRTHVNQDVVLTVTDGRDESPVEDAVVNGKSSNHEGKVTIRFGNAGSFGVKAHKKGTIRSNRHVIHVDP